MYFEVAVEIRLEFLLANVYQGLAVLVEVVNGETVGVVIERNVEGLTYFTVVVDGSR